MVVVAVARAHKAMEALAVALGDTRRASFQSSLANSSQSPWERRALEQSPAARLLEPVARVPLVVSSAQLAETEVRARPPLPMEAPPAPVPAGRST